MLYPEIAFLRDTYALRLCVNLSFVTWLTHVRFPFLSLTVLENPRWRITLVIRFTEPCYLLTDFDLFMWGTAFQTLLTYIHVHIHIMHNEVIYKNQHRFEHYFSGQMFLETFVYRYVFIKNRNIDFFFRYNGNRKSDIKELKRRVAIKVWDRTSCARR